MSKFNKLGLAKGIALNFYASVEKGSKLKVSRFLGQIPTFVEVTEEKLIEGLFSNNDQPHSPPSFPILNRVSF